jgi:hypothetical protein
MPEISAFENIAQSFLTDHPIGTQVTGERMVNWVQQKANGHVIGADLNIPDPRKKLATIRRHLNEGARTQNVAQDKRFVITVEDAKRATFSIVDYAHYGHAKAIEAFVRSAGAAIAPLNSAMRVLDDQKMEELSAEQQGELTRDRNDLQAIKDPIRQAYAGETDRRMIATLVAGGQTEAQARALLGTWRTIEPYQKLLKKFS